MNTIGIALSLPSAAELLAELLACRRDLAQARRYRDMMREELKDAQVKAEALVERADKLEIALMLSISEEAEAQADPESRRERTNGHNKASR